MTRRLLPILAALAAYPLCAPLSAAAEGPAAAEPTAPAYRTDSANEALPWYQLEPGEFPPAHSEHRVGGELVEADFIHRCGQFRADGTGELVSFTLPPYGSVYYLDAEADLRDVPLGTRLQFFLYQDEKGAFTKAVSLRDDYSLLSSQGLVYRLEKAKPAAGEPAEENGGMVRFDVTRQKPGEKTADGSHEELIADDRTRIWKGDQRIKPSDLAPGEELLADFTGVDAPSGRQGGIRCTDIWVGADARKGATERERKTHTAFLKQRGLPARIDRVEGKNLVVTLFGDPDGLRALFKDQGIVPEQWASEHRQIKAVVANEELRTYNPPVDNESSVVLESRQIPTDRYGHAGVQWTIEPRLLLEGFRKGRIIRLFAHPSWPIEDMPMGEGLYTERPGAKIEEESPNQYSYRTDFGNEQIPWFQLKPGEFPPYQSQHVVTGELLKTDPTRRSGQFRADGTGELIDFTMPPFGTALYLNAEAELADLPLGTRYSFSLYQDERGSFTRAAVIVDEFTRLARETLTCRVEAARPAEGKLFLANQLAPVLDDKDHPVQPPDLGHGEYGVDDSTRLWKGDKPIRTADLAPGDALLVNLTGRTAKSPSRCTEIWDGPESIKHATEQQRAAHQTFLKKHGMPAWIESVDGKTVTITFFAGNRKDFQDLLGGEPWGQSVSVKRVDDDLRPVDDRIDTLHFKDRLPERSTAGTYGSAGVRWALEADKIPEGYEPGKVIRVFKPGWPTEAGGK